MKTRDENTSQQKYDAMTKKMYGTYSHAWKLIEAALDINSGSAEATQWQEFRTALITQDAVNDLWKDRDFKRGVLYLNDIIDICIQTEFNYEIGGKDEHARERENIDVAHDFSEDFIYEVADDDSDIKGVLKLREALEIIVSSAPAGIDEWSSIHVRMALKTISECQQMVFQVAEEEKRKRLKKAA